MGRTIYRLLLVAFFGISLVLSIYAFHLREVNAKLEQSVSAAEEKTNAFKKKYSEEKAKGAALQRAKLSADSKMRELVSAVERAGKELLALKDSESRSTRELAANLKACRKELVSATGNYEKLKAENANTQGKLKQALATLREMNAELAKNLKSIGDLQSELKNDETTIARMALHNQEFAELSKELLVRFDETGIFTSMINREPLTQAKRVDLEKMIQEYLDRIDTATLSDLELN